MFFTDDCDFEKRIDLIFKYIKEVPEEIRWFWLLDAALYGISLKCIREEHPEYYKYSVKIG